MNDVNYIKGQLQSWLPCKNWLETRYPEKLFELEHELENLMAISYEEKTGASGIDESMRRSIVIDKQNNLELERRQCENTIAFCESILKRVKTQYQDVFYYRFATYATISWISYQTGYETDTIYKIVDRETERLANE